MLKSEYYSKCGQMEQRTTETRIERLPFLNVGEIVIASDGNDKIVTAFLMIVT